MKAQIPNQGFQGECQTGKVNRDADANTVRAQHQIGLIEMNFFPTYRTLARSLIIGIAATSLLLVSPLAAYAQDAGDLGSAAAAQADVAGTIKEILVTGNKVESTQGILATMRSKVGQAYNASTVDTDKQTLYSLGVFQSVPIILPKQNSDGTVSLTVQVSEYPIVKEIRIVGNTIIPTKDLLKLVTIKVGQIYNVNDGVVTSNNIQQAYLKKGNDANVTGITFLPESPNTINIVVEEATVGSVQIKPLLGPLHTKPYVFRRLIQTRKGQVFNYEKWQEDVRRLYDTNWFQDVKPADDTTTDPGKHDLSIGVQEAKTGNINLGLQVDPQSSFAGFIRLGDSNYRGTGQNVGVGFTQGIQGGGPSVDLNYSNPFIDDHLTSLNVSLYSHIIYRFTGTLFGSSSLPTGANEYYERRTGGTVGLSRPIGDHLFGSISTRIEGVKTSNLNTTNTNDFIQQDGTIASVGFGFSRDTRDVAADASRGSFLRLTLEPGYSDITTVGGAIANSNQSYLGTSFFTKVGFDYRKYFTKEPPRKNLDDPRHVLAFWLRGGTILGKVPFFEQYFAGGADTIRGYDQDRFWGKNYIIGTAEYRLPLQKSFSAIFFVDYGGAWGGYGTVNNFTQYDTFRLHLGYGPGLSFKTPLGQIRLDYGINETGGSRLDFEIGTSF